MSLLKALLDAKKATQDKHVCAATHIEVTASGIAFQAAQMRTGELTEARMRDAGVSDEIISEVKRLASIGQ